MRLCVCALVTWLTACVRCVQLLLAGQTPETALSAALAATNFYLQQQQLLNEEREAQLTQKLEKMQAACRAKLKASQSKFEPAAHANHAGRKAWAASA